MSRKSYDGKVDAVRALNLEVANGEFLTLLGPSGSGKTTTLTMLAGFEQPTAGRIFVAAEDITNVPVEKRGIGMVFQNYALFPNMTVGENIGFPLKVRRLPSRGDRRRRSSARWPWCGWRAWPTAGRSSSRAASSSASPWRARWCSSRGWCCSTSRSARSTASCASRCSTS